MIKGFSKLDKKGRMDKVSELLPDSDEFTKAFRAFDHPDPEIQKELDGFSENTLANFPLPFGVAPNFKVNGKDYMVPMVIEESSVVAAASWAAGFWYSRGGFRVEAGEMLKEGQLHFTWTGDGSRLEEKMGILEREIRKNASGITANMERRGGGIHDIRLLDKSAELRNYFQLRFRFLTADSMGANFINSVLEDAGKTLQQFTGEHFPGTEYQTVMAILSNYTPDCRVKAEVRCKVRDLEGADREMSPENFARKFILATDIAGIDTFRAVTHNKGIFNGMDAVVLATGNDFRALEAAGHAYASRDGKYRSLSRAGLEGEEFYFILEVPMALGTVGGLTSLHPLAKWAIRILGNPGAKELMMITASAGLANNFAAVKALITQGIQKGHMKMHLGNILGFHKANEEERRLAMEFFSDRSISFSEVEKFLAKLRSR